MLKVCLSVDVEDFVSFKQRNPSWSSFQRFKGLVNGLIKDFRYSRTGFEKIHELVLEEKVPISFMLVGKLFSPKSEKGFIDWGYHSLNHLPLTLINDEQLEKEVKNVQKAVSFTAPMWMIEDKKDPERVFKVLKKEGYKIVTYRGVNDGTVHEHFNAVKPVFERHGIKCVHVSGWFEGNFSFGKISDVLRDIEQNFDKEGVYLLTTHDFTHRNLRNFKKIIGVLKRWEKEKLIRLVNLKQLVR